MVEDGMGTATPGSFALEAPGGLPSAGGAKG